MSTGMDRKLRILNLLREHGSMSCSMIHRKLKGEYNVSSKTIRRDIEELSRSYPLLISKGRNGGITYSYNIGETARRFFWRQEMYKLLYQAACKMESQRDIESWDAILTLDMEKCFSYNPPSWKMEQFPSILMEVNEFAEYLKISPTTAYELLKEEEFSFVVRGNSRKVINRSLFERWIIEHTGIQEDGTTGGD